MSRIALTPHASGTGTFTIAAPGTNTDRTLTLPDATGTILSSAAIASQAQAEAGTDNTTVMTPLRTAQAVAALGFLQTIDARTTSGSFTVPAGVTQLYVFAAAGGGGGGAGNQTDGPPVVNRTGGAGGFGGTAASYITVTPGASISYTVGAGGAGTNTTGAAGSAGGTTTVNTISCTGGAGGAPASTNANGANGASGAGSGGNLTNSFGFQTACPFLPLDASVLSTVFTIYGQTPFRANASSATAEVAYSTSGSLAAGAAGSGEVGTGGSNATGGVGGVVIFVY